MSDWRQDGGDLPAKPRWSARGLEIKLALAIALPVLAGGLVASFLPWAELRWLVFAGTALLAGAGCWVWMRTTLVRQLRVIERAMASGRLTDLRGLPVGGGWGELSGLADDVAAFLARQQDLERDARELARVRESLAALARAAAAWAEDERTPDWSAACPEPAPGLAPLVDALALAAARIDERLAEARAVSGLVRETVDDAIGRTRVAAATAERQFVEATSLLTVLRELKRWTGEVAQGVDALAGEAAAPDARLPEARAAASAALDSALLSLRQAAGVAERARTMGEEAGGWHDAAALSALAAAGAALGGVRRRDVDLERLADALTGLVSGTRALRERAADLTRRAEEDLARLAELGGAVEQRLAALGAEAALAGAAAPEAGRGAGASAASRRALDRVQEMLREAMARAEKLVKESERTSSESLRAGESWAAARDEVDGLAARLAPPGEAAGASGPGEVDAADAPHADASARAAPAPPPDERPQRPLRVLGPDDLLPDDETWSHG